MKKIQLTDTEDDVPWGKNTELEELLLELNPAMIVGGAVRNAIMGIPITDIDIATIHNPHLVSSIAKNCGFKVFETGLDHGTVTCVKNNNAYEVTTLRVDEETDGRHAKVRFSDSWEADARRRDFTINALYSTFGGEVQDYVGGIEDIKTGLIRFIGDPAKRITEDYLRILRFFRFYTLYGCKYDLMSLESCYQFAEHLKIISRERCTSEFMKILKDKDPWKGISIMHTDIFVYSGLPMPNFDKINALMAQEKTLNLKASYIGKLLTFSREHELVLSRREKNLTSKIRDCPPLEKKSDYVLWINSAPEEIIYDGFLINGRCNEIVPKLNTWMDNRFPIAGADLLNAGLLPGPQISLCLNDMLNFFCNQDEPLTKSEIIKNCEFIIKKYKKTSH